MFSGPYVFRGKVREGFFSQFDRYGGCGGILHHSSYFRGRVFSMAVYLGSPLQFSV